jgi:hypothetical protein
MSDSNFVWVRAVLKLSHKLGNMDVFGLCWSPIWLWNRCPVILDSLWKFGFMLWNYLAFCVFFSVLLVLGVGDVTRWISPSFVDPQLVAVNTFSFNFWRNLAMMDGSFKFHHVMVASKECIELAVRIWVHWTSLICIWSPGSGSCL